MHSGRIVIANRSAVGLKGVLFPSSKQLGASQVIGGKYWHEIVQHRGGRNIAKTSSWPLLQWCLKKETFFIKLLATKMYHFRS